MFNGFNAHPATISEAIRQVILCLVLFGVVQWTDQQIAGFLMMISAILALFTRSNTISTGKLDQRVEERVAQVQQGVRQANADQADYQGKNYTGGTGMFLLALAATLMLTGCAAKQQQLALQVDRSVHGGLAAVQDSVDSLCDSKVMASDDCKVFNQRLVPALEAGAAYNRTVAAERSGRIADVVVAVGRLTEAITALVPEKYRPELLSRIQAILNSAFEEAKQ